MTQLALPIRHAYEPRARDPDDRERYAEDDTDDTDDERKPDEC